MRHYEIRAGSDTLHFYVYTTRVADAESRIRALEALFQRMPPAHRRTAYPVFVVDALPGGRRTGGGNWSRTQARTQWLGRQRVTGVPDADLERYALSHNGGVIGITAAALADEGRARGIHQLSVFHEIGHCVDHHLGLVPPGATVVDLRGQRYRTPNVREYAVEAYSRWIVRPSRLCRDDALPPGETQDRCTQRTLALLRRSPAFAGIHAAPTDPAPIPSTPWAGLAADWDCTRP